MVSRIAMFIVAVTTVLAAPASLHAQNQIRWDVLDAGFAQSASGGNRIVSAAGQSFVGRSVNSSTTIVSGFLVDTSLGAPPQPACVNSQWPVMFGQNLPVCTAPSAQQEPFVVPDGAGGAIVFWTDLRHGSGTRAIYAQRVNACGIPLWAQDGIAIIDIGEQAFEPVALADGQGGAFVAWEDQRAPATGGDIYAQRINAAGALLWDSAGVPVCVFSRRQLNPTLVSDDAGGVIITWQDNRGAFGTYDDAYAQRLNGNGVPLWQANGVAISTGTGDERNEQIVGDGAGGAIIAYWYSPYVKVQRVNSAGVVQWATNGIPVSTINASFPIIALNPDGSGGAIVVWSATVAASASNIYANRIAHDGSLPWGQAEINVCVASGSQTEPTAVDDGAGGVFVTWQDGRHVGQNSKVYAQRIDNAGSGVWTQDGIPIDTLNTYFPGPTLTRDGADGVILTWLGTRSGASSVYAQRVDAAGVIQWTPLGVGVAGGGVTNVVITADVDGGAIFAFQNNAGMSSADVFAKHVFANGSIGSPTAVQEGPVSTPSTLMLNQNFPNPFNPTTSITYELDRTTPVVLAVYDVLGREVARLVDGVESPGVKTVRWHAGDAASGVYFYRLHAGDIVLTKKLMLLR